MSDLDEVFDELREKVLQDIRRQGEELKKRLSPIEEGELKESLDRIHPQLYAFLAVNNHNMSEISINTSIIQGLMDCLSKKLDRQLRDIKKEFSIVPYPNTFRSSIEDKLNGIIQEQAASKKRQLEIDEKLIRLLSGDKS